MWINYGVLFITFTYHFKQGICLKGLSFPLRQNTELTTTTSRVFKKARSAAVTQL